MRPLRRSRASSQHLLPGKQYFLLSGLGSSVLGMILVKGRRTTIVSISGHSKGTAAIALVVLAVFTIVLGGGSLGPLSFGGNPASAPPPPLTPGGVSGQVPPTATLSRRAISGKVVDAFSGQPIAAVEVTAGGILTETTNDGSFSFDSLPLDVQ